MDTLNGGLQAATAEHARLEAKPSDGQDATDPEVARLVRLLRASDDIMGELEQQNLIGADGISGALRLRLTLLCGSAPDRFLPRAQRLRTPTDAIDLLFEIQEVLCDTRRRRTTEFRPGWWLDPPEGEADAGADCGSPSQRRP